MYVKTWSFSPVLALCSDLQSIVIGGEVKWSSLCFLAGLRIHIPLHKMIFIISSRNVEKHSSGSKMTVIGKLF